MSDDERQPKTVGEAARLVFVRADIAPFDDGHEGDDKDGGLDTWDELREKPRAAWEAIGEAATAFARRRDQAPTRAVVDAARELLRVYSIEGQPREWQIHGQLVAWAALKRALEALAVTDPPGSSCAVAVSP